jgi:hypothetical protein
MHSAPVLPICPAVRAGGPPTCPASPVTNKSRLDVTRRSCGTSASGLIPRLSRFDFRTPQGSCLAERSRGVAHRGEEIRKGNATDGVRQALAQLLMYRHFLDHRTAPTLVALFSEPIGQAYAAFLGGLGIMSMWPTDDQWVGSASAVAEGLAALPSSEDQWDLRDVHVVVAKPLARRLRHDAARLSV